MSKRITPRITVHAFGPCLFAYNAEAHIDIQMQLSPSLIDEIVGGKRGLSPEIKIKRWECSICHKNYENCDHKVDEKYGNEICKVSAKDVETQAVSLVSSPADSRAQITDLLVVTEELGKKKFQWFGFQVTTEDQRFKHIQRAYEGNLIPLEVAFRFGKYFSIQLEGTAVYP